MSFSSCCKKPVRMVLETNKVMALDICARYGADSDSAMTEAVPVGTNAVSTTNRTETINAPLAVPKIRPNDLSTQPRNTRCKSLRISAAITPTTTRIPQNRIPNPARCRVSGVLIKKAR